MNNIKEFYDFVSEIWKYVKSTPAPAQDDNAEWERIDDKNHEYLNLLMIKFNNWMEYLRKESLKNG